MIFTIKIIFAVLAGNSLGLIQTQYKRIYLEGSEWSEFISKTMDFKTNGIIECGTVCSAQFDGGCDLYAPQKSPKLCHIGYFDNTVTDYLTGQSGTQPVYINLSNCRIN